MLIQRHWWIFIAIAITVMMVDVDITAVNLAITQMAAQLHLNLSQAQWIINGYTIAAAAFMAFAGRLTDAYGYRRIFIAALWAFIIFSLAVAFSIGPITIIISRILQGATIAFIFPVGAVIIRHVFPQKQQAFAIGLMVSIAGLSQAIGPSLGGVMVEWLNWRWIFIIDAPLGIVALILAYYFLSKQQTKKAIQLPPLVVMSFALGLFSFMVALNEAATWGIASLGFIFTFSTAVCLLLVFARVEWRAKYPLLELHLFRNRNFTIVNVIRFVTILIFASLLFVLSLLLQTVLQYSALDAGSILLVMTLMISVFSIASGHFVGRFGVKLSLIIALIALSLGLGLLAFINMLPTLSLILPALALLGIGFALVVPATSVGLMHSVPPQKTGIALGLFFTNGFVGSSFGVAISGWLLQGLSFSKLTTLLALQHFSVSTQNLKLLQDIMVGAKAMNSLQREFPTSIANNLVTITKTAFLQGVSWMMLSALLLMFWSLVLVHFYRNYNSIITRKRF